MAKVNLYKIIGSIYFNTDEEGVLNRIRVLSFQNDKVVKVKDIDTGKKFKIELEKLSTEYCKLIPDGFISFTIGSVNQAPNKEEENPLEDVIVSLLRCTPDGNVENVPFCVCRQNVNDWFNNSINAGRYDRTVGMCMSLETVPEDFPYYMMVACDKIIRTCIVATYLDDTLEDILECVPRIKDYNNILKDLFDYHKKYYGGIYGDNETVIDGYCIDLKTLLTDNDFMYDFHRAFGIVEINCLEKELTEFLEDGKFKDQLAKELVMDEIGIRFSKENITKYDRDIDILKLEGDHILLCDKFKNIFLMKFKYEEDVITEEYIKQRGKDAMDRVANNFQNSLISIKK